MTTYFTQSNIMKRFFFLTGKTKDTFVDESLAAYGIECMLYDHLQKLGYERIMFYAKTQKLFCADRHSYELVVAPSAAPIKAAPKARIVRGPLGGNLLSPAAAKDDKVKPLPNVLHFGKMNDMDAFQRIDACMRDKSHRTAVIFTNAEDFLAFFGDVRTNRGSESIRSKIFDSINDYDGLSYDNSNIMLFVFPQRTISEVMSVYSNSTAVWSLFFKPRMEKGNIIEIGAPTKAEIRNAINLVRVKHGLQVDFESLPKMSALFAKTAFSQYQSLSELMYQMKLLADSGKKLDFTAAERLCGKTQQKPALERLDELIGLGNVKAQIKAFAMRAKNTEKAQEYGYIPRIEPQPKYSGMGMNLNFALTGNPGTGKTTVAKLLGEIYYELGFLPGGHTVKVTRSDLVAGYVGQTAIKTRACIDRAMGGVLFVDEAYSLVPKGDSGNDFGAEAIAEILEAMTDHAGQFAVIVAGYPKDMERFIASNSGLPRRFDKVIHIDDYSPEELEEILYLNLGRRQYTVDTDMKKLLPQFLFNWHRSRDSNWGNAGNIEKLVEHMYDSWCLRAGEKDNDNKAILCICDIPEDLRIHAKPISEAKKDAINLLNSLIGLESVKSRINGLRRAFKISGKASTPGHYIFAGNPGTGKTTVARLLGDILCDAGVLRRGHVVEVNRDALVGTHVGETAPKTKAKIEEALDGVLFVDEAYSLCAYGQEDNDYGKEAINTLVAYMETYRDRLCVICAGYTDAMKRFVSSNEGLESRFTDTIVFDDYNADEMVDILKSFAGTENTLTDEFLSNSKAVFDFWTANKGADFGNARDVRKYFAECRDALYLRLENKYPDFHIPNDEKTAFTGEDIPERYKQVIDGGEKEPKSFEPIPKGNIATSYGTEYDYKRDLPLTVNALLFIKIKICGANAYGSGFIITKDGYAVTCNHVIDKASSIEVRVRIPGRVGGDDSWHKAEVVRADKELDIALMKLEGSNFPAMPLLPRGVSSDVGDKISLLGYPFGAKLSDSERELNDSVFEGKVASKQIQNGFEKQFVDMQAKRGNSGGPVINRENGLVVGILCGSQTEGDARLVEEINYIRPIKYVWDEFIEK